ncbi:hypothetical protein PU560_02570, partial [Georgenia sp. 10Sc9-8]|nr:hypothetical protein [Georgenia halotolerans]
TLSLARVQEYARNMRRLTPPQFRGAEVRVVYAPRSKPEMSEYGISSAAAARIGDQRPGPSLAEALEELQLAAADDATVVEAIAAYERLASWAVAEQARAVRELADRRGSSSVAQASTSNEIAARLGITGRAAENKVGFALALTSYPEGCRRPGRRADRCA